MQKNSIKNFFFDNLDTIACKSGVVIGILIASLYLISKTIYLPMLGLALTFASLMYLALNNRKTVPSTLIQKSKKIFYEIIFFVLFSVSLLVLFTHEGRPFSYFILMALCSGFVALSILNLKSNFDIILQIIKIAMLSINLKYSIFIFYEGSGVDYWFHLKLNSLLAHEGFINVLIDKEYFFPLMHIQTAIHQIITNTPIKDATIFAIMFPLVISTICVFLVVRKLFDEKIGLIAMLIVNITDFHTYWGYSPQTTTFGICMFFFLIFVIFQIAILNQKQIIWSVIVILFFTSMIVAHAVSSFILFITITGLFVGSYVYKKFFDNHATVFPPILTIFLYVIILFQHWIIAIYNERAGTPFFNVIVSTLDYYVTEHADFLNRPETIAEFSKTLPPFIEMAANTAGLSLLIFLATIGCLFWLSKKYRNRFTFSMLTCTILLLVITFGFPLFGLRNIIPSRWFAFIYFFLSILAAFTFLTLFSTIPKQRLGGGVLFIVFISLTFFMTTSTISNLDSPLWLQESTISTTYTNQELKGAETLTMYSNAVFSDSRFGGSVIGDYYGSQTASLYNRDLSNREGEIFVWRNYMVDRPIQLFVNVEGYYKPVEIQIVIGKNFLKSLEKMQNIYSNGGVKGYYISHTVF